jgi:hypothetical protein
MLGQALLANGVNAPFASGLRPLDVQQNIHESLKPSSYS